MRPANIELIHQARQETRRAYFMYKRQLEEMKILYLRALADHKEAEHMINTTHPEHFKTLNAYHQWREARAADRKGSRHTIAYTTAKIKEIRENLKRTIDEMKHHPRKEY